MKLTKVENSTPLASTKAIIEVPLSTSSGLITKTFKKCSITLLDSNQVESEGVIRMAISYDADSREEEAFKKIGVTCIVEYPEVIDDALDCIPYKKTA